MLRLNADCLLLVFNELQDKESLYSCILVNREWCRLAVPTLWKNYSWPNINESSFFNTILSWLPSSSKKLLSINNIKLPSSILLKPPLFNYISLCEFPEAEYIKRIIEIVLVDNNLQNNNCNERNLLEQEIYKLFIGQCRNIKELVWQTSQPLSLFPGASTCFSRLNRLSIDLDYVDSNSLHGMARICRDLNKLEIFYCSQDLPGLISLIDAQRNLSIVKIYNNNNRKGSYEGLGKALSRKGNTIKFFHFGLVGAISPSFLISLVNLKQLSIYNDENNIKDVRELQEYLAISEFPNLKILIVTGLSCFKELSMLIEKTKGNILRVYIFTINQIVRNTGMLIKSITNNCSKIKFLYTYIEPRDFIHVKSLLLSCKRLEEISFGSINDNNDNDNDNVGDELLNILIKFSPKSLTYITISGSWKYSINAFERFFESYKERPLYHFHIFNSNQHYITESHKSIVRKYIKEGVIKKSNCV